MDLENCSLPITFHICHSNSSENEWDEFVQYFNQCNEKVWIVKPGENSNKGYGIKVFNTINEIRQYTNSSSKHTQWVVQKYIEKPMLIQGRKFDIRIYGLITSIKGVMKAYFFKYC